ncbi:MAG: diaminopimelate dehydrogenase [Clostridia bacterium]|nr:diaminopimelate dehydrogenase [Clostridia bacterium]
MRIGIYGYGNLGRGVECALHSSKDAQLVGIFTRRAPSSIKTVFGTPVFSSEKVSDFKKKIDVMIICGGSATDLPEMTPALAMDFNVVDSFDNHADVMRHFAAVDKAASSGGKLALISSGWDPGLFSLARLYFSAFLPEGKTYTFWGKGVSQGHSDAVRNIEGVLDARQYTIPNDEAMADVLTGNFPTLRPTDMHRRECYVVAKPEANKEKMTRKIKNMPAYFRGYDTSVSFISTEELLEKHGKMSHGGRVIRSGKTGVDFSNLSALELNLKLDSNPEFTAGVLLASARAVYRMSSRGDVGAKTLFDVTPTDFSELAREEIIATLL